ncbi:Phage DNA packaging protein, Nu1 subunit of terminase [Nitrosospira sp. Nsp11]|uniref:terminase small subunit n=1 Tax=Nitrosospira sp. Nsp11 TaxID=1855338 RepID=UPI00091FF460|nr:terminase small subunit [Nitrosospira sp. Nsp11]SHM05813.1 Phage DNA packaging protein, Nu1 subunit of terminase [Nitrosospira sp. Nsp11]
MGKLVNKRELSEIVGVSERTLTSWQKDGLPIAGRAARGASGQYDTEKVIAWMIARQVGKVEEESPKDRLSRLQGDKVEIEISEKLKELIPVSEIEPAWFAMVASARSFLRSQPDRLAQLLEVTDGVEAKRDLIAETFDDALRKLAEYEPTEDADEAGNEDVQPASEDDSGSVGREV